ncbi:TolC family protein [Myroides sp. LJL116]
MMKYISLSTLWWIAITIPQGVVAQQSTSFVLRDLWTEVEQNFPGLQSKTAQVESVELDKRATKSNLLPQIKLQGQNNFSTLEPAIGSFFAQPGTFTINGSKIDNGQSSTTFSTYGSTTMEWEVFSFGKNRADNKSADALYQKALSEQDTYILSVKKELSQRYVMFLYQRAKLDWSNKNMQRLKEVTSIASGLSLSGLKPVADSLLASSSYMQARAEYNKNQGLEQASLIKVLELTRQSDLPHGIDLQVFLNPSYSLVEDKAEVDLNHPILEALDNQKSFYQWSAKSQSKGYLPSVNLLAGYSVRGSGINSTGNVSENYSKGWENTANNYAFGIGITWNLTQLHTKKVTSSALQKKAKSTDLLWKEYSQAMQADLLALQAQKSQRYKQLLDTSSAVEQSTNAYNMYLARYKSGLISLSELLQIRLVLEQSENTHLQASMDYWLLLCNQAELSNDFSYLFSNL